MAEIIKTGERRITVLTEVGNIVFCAITGKGVKKIKSDKMIYKVALGVDKTEKKSLHKIIMDFWDENRPKGNKQDEPANFDNLVYKGKGEFKKNNYISPWTYAMRDEDEGEKQDVGLVDGDGNELDKKKYGQMGDGTTGRLSVAMVVYGDEDDAGVSMYLNAVQLEHFTPYAGGGGNGANDFSRIDGDKLGSGGGDFKKKKKKKGKKEK